MFLDFLKQEGLFSTWEPSGGSTHKERGKKETCFLVCLSSLWLASWSILLLLHSATNIGTNTIVIVWQSKHQQLSRNSPGLSTRLGLLRHPVSWNEQLTDSQPSQFEVAIVGIPGLHPDHESIIYIIQRYVTLVYDVEYYFNCVKVY